MYLVIAGMQLKFAHGDCSCSSFVSNYGYGNCQKSYQEKGPICYVNEPSTCNDLEIAKSSTNAVGKKYSLEACSKNQGIFNRHTILFDNIYIYIYIYWCNLFVLRTWSCRTMSRGKHGLSCSTPRLSISKRAGYFTRY